MKSKINARYDAKLCLKFLFSVGLVCLFSVGLVSPVRAAEASFYIASQSENFEIGQTFSVDVLINSEEASINAAQAKINFPSEILKVISISKSNSIFSFWIQEPVWSNSKGEISFGGGLPSPGFQGKDGKVMTVFFQGKIAGTATVNFKDEAILENSAKGTNLFSFSQEGNYSIVSKDVLPEIPVTPKIDSSAKVEIDTQPPHPFEIVVDNEGDPTNPFPLLFFKAKDDVSGVDYYEIKIGTKDVLRIAETESNPFRMPHQAPGVHDISVKAVDRSQNFTESKTEVKIESITVPEITVCPSVFASGEEAMYIAGTTLPDSQVIVFLKTDKELVKKWEVSSNQKGEWFLEEDGLFRSGMYEITAKTQDKRGAISNPTKPCLVTVVLSGIAVGSWIIDYKALTLLLVVILLIALICVFYLFYKVKKTRNLIEQETEDLKHKFYKEYSELYNGVQVELKELKKARGNREIAEEEKKREQELLKNLNDVKEVLEKELKDIEDIK